MDTVVIIDSVDCVTFTFTWHSGHSDLLHLAKKQQGCLVRYFKLDYTYLSRQTSVNKVTFLFYVIL